MLSNKFTGCDLLCCRSQQIQKPNSWLRLSMLSKTPLPLLGIKTPHIVDLKHWVSQSLMSRSYWPCHWGMTPRKMVTFTNKKPDRQAIIIDKVDRLLSHSVSIMKRTSQTPTHSSWSFSNLQTFSVPLKVKAPQRVLPHCKWVRGESPSSRLRALTANLYLKPCVQFFMHP